MKLKNLIFKSQWIFLLAFIVSLIPSACLYAQPASIPIEVRSYDGKEYDRVVLKGRNGREEFLSLQPSGSSKYFPTEGGFVSVETVTESNAVALRLVFSEFKLGQQGRLTIRSLEDGAEQHFSQKELEQWNGMTAFFNGNSLQVILQADPSQSGSNYRISQVIAELPDGKQLSTAPEMFREEAGLISPNARPESYCGNGDKRTPSSFKAIGRLLPVGCTGWIVKGGKILTAGHCVGDGMKILEFNVPESTTSGQIRHPDPRHQYRVNIENAQSADDGDYGLGNDWGVFSVDNNTETGKSPIDAQGAYFEVEQSTSVNTILVAGYGTDKQRKRNLVQQTARGQIKGLETENTNDVILKHTAETSKGNSGSPIILLDDNGHPTMSAIGIHTDGDCMNGGVNSGTAFTNQALFNAIHGH